MKIHTSLLDSKRKKISLKKAKNFIYSKSNGAESIFVGRVRNNNKGKKVTAVTYAVHKRLAMKSFTKICNEGKKKFDKKAKIFLEHATNYVPVGGISILIAVGSGHRDEAYKISRYILEQVKHHSPIWKKEHYIDGEKEWIPGHSLRAKEKVK